MVALAWILSVVGAGWAWIVLLAGGMRTAPKLPLRDVVLAGWMPAGALLLAHGELLDAEPGARPWIAAGLPWLLAVATLLLLLQAFVFQPSPPRLVIRLRMLLPFGARRWRGDVVHWRGERFTVEARKGPLVDTSKVTNRIHLGDDGGHVSERLLTCKGKDGGRRQIAVSTCAVLDYVYRTHGVVVDDLLVTSVGDQLAALRLPELELLWSVRAPFGGPGTVTLCGDEVELESRSNRSRHELRTGAERSRQAAPE